MNINDRIKYLTDRLHDLEKEKLDLEQELSKLTSFSISLISEVEPASFKVPETPEEKIALFLSLFRCREDIYPHRWENKKTGKSGYSPACGNEWKNGICDKPKVKCSECKHSLYLPLDSESVRLHLEGKEIIGTYAIRKDDSTTFLAADFDGSTWRDDVIRFKHAANEFGVDAAVEISRSGEGAHSWIFFATPLPASLARRLGTVIMTRALSQSGYYSLSSYDRFFPNQDYLPSGGFGNLIALPLQYESRKNGKTIFVDDKLTPYDNQWEYLSNVKRLSQDIIVQILDDISISKEQLEISDSEDIEVNVAERDIDPLIDEINEKIYEGVVEIELSAMLSINVNAIPARLLSALRRIATFANPKFFELQRMRFSTWNTPRYICSAEYDGKTIKLPRGTIDSCKDLLMQSGAVVKINDARPLFEKINVIFKGELREDQRKAVEELMKHNFGVLISPPGSGKTVMGCSLIAERSVPTLILVHRKQLVEQWKERLLDFLDIDKKSIGIIGAGSKKSKGVIDIAMLQTISRKEEIKEILSGYGQIIIDECHHIPAVSFEAALKEIPARYVVGLTATPYRKDGLQAILFMQCGPIRYEIEEKADPNLKKRVIVRDTDFNIQHDSRSLPIYEIWEYLVNDNDRLNLVADDIISVIKNKRFPLILSERKDHLYKLKERLEEISDVQGMKCFLFEGDLGKKARASAIIEINEMIKKDEKPYILSTGSLIGEGFDMPQLDTLFLAMPLSFKGRVIQYAGRLHRPYEGKNEVIIYDYCDSNLGLTVSMFKKRVLTYKNIGYKIESTGKLKIDKWIGLSK